MIDLCLVSIGEPPRLHQGRFEFGLARDPPCLGPHSVDHMVRLARRFVERFGQRELAVVGALCQGFVDAVEAVAKQLPTTIPVLTGATQIGLRGNPRAEQQYVEFTPQLGLSSSVFSHPLEFEALRFVIVGESSLEALQS